MEPPVIKFLDGYDIFLSGMPEEYKKKAAAVLQRYGGNCMETFSPECGVLVVGVAGTKEFSDVMYKKEYSNIVVVTRDWIRACKDQPKAVPKYSSFKVPPFYGLVVTCTEVSVEERERISVVINKHGGTYSPSFHKDKSTHLVAQDGKSEKYARAKEWRKRVVTTQWVDDCVKQGKWLNEQLYPVHVPEKKVQPQQPVSKAEAKPTSSKPKVVEPVTIKKPSAPKFTNMIELLDAFLVSLVLYSTHKEQTNGENASSNGNNDSNSPESFFLSADSTSPGTPVATPLPQPSPPCLHELCESTGYSAVMDVFRGDVFYVAGCDAKLSDYATICVVAGGGRRSTVLTQDVTKVLLGDHCSDSIYSELSRHPIGVTHVNLFFLLVSLFSLPLLLQLLLQNVPFTTHYETEGLAEVTDIDELLRWEIKPRVEKVVVKSEDANTAAVLSTSSGQSGDGGASGGGNNQNNNTPRTINGSRSTSTTSLNSVVSTTSSSTDFVKPPIFRAGGGKGNYLAKFKKEQTEYGLTGMTGLTGLTAPTQGSKKRSLDETSVEGSVVSSVRTKRVLVSHDIHEESQQVHFGTLEPY